VIFAKADHIKQIIAGTKTQTRRPTDRYKVGRIYAIQPGRGEPGILEGRILITDKWMEAKELGVENNRIVVIPSTVISPEDAQAEGGYTPEEYEALYEEMYPGWMVRYAYEFKVLPEMEQLYECGFPRGMPPYLECCTLIHGSVCQRLLRIEEMKEDA